MTAGPHDPDEPGEKSARHSGPGSGAQPANPGSDQGSNPGSDPAAGADGDPQDIEARWQQIVADLGDLDVAAAELSDEARTDGHDAATAGGTDPGGAVDDGGSDETDDPGGGPLAQTMDPRSWRPDPAVEEAEDHFVPPDPGPVLGGDPLLTMAWTAAVGVPVLLIVVAVVWRSVPMSWLAAAGAVFLVGVGLLLWRMPHGDEDDPSDDGPGAVV